MATIVKKVIVGTPIRKVSAGSFDLSGLGGVNISGDAGTGQNIGEGIHNDILVYDSAAGEYQNLQTLRTLKIDQLTKRITSLAKKIHKIEFKTNKAIKIKDVDKKLKVTKKTAKKDVE